MESNSDYTPQQYRKYNGQMVLKALRAIGNEVSADDLAFHISEHIGAREEIILPEVKQVLRRGIINGFLIRNGTNYSLVGEEDNVQTDYVSRRKRRSSSELIDLKKRRRTSNVMLASNENKNVEEGSDSDYSDEEQEESDDNRSISWKNNRPIVKLYEMLTPEVIGEENDEEDDEYVTSDNEEVQVVTSTQRPLLAWKKTQK